MKIKLAPGLIDTSRRSPRIYTLELCVLEGAQSGARIPLPLAQPQSVGTDLQNDIYFEDASAGPLAVELVRGRSDVSITLVHGAAICENTPLKIGRKTRIAINTPVRMGATVFVICASADDECSNTGDQSCHTLIAAPNRRPLLVFVVGCAVLGSGVASLPAKLNGSLPIAVASNSSRQTSQRMKSTGMSETPNANVSGDVMESVRDIFRNHGVTARVSSLSAGQLKAETQTSDLDALARAEFAVRSDVPGLINLETVNRPPEIAPEVTPPKPLREQAGKAIRLVMVGTPSYVVTEDSSRYFVGSQLPTGHTIVSIAENAVTLEKNGDSSELNL